MAGMDLEEFLFPTSKPIEVGNGLGLEEAYDFLSQIEEERDALIARRTSNERVSDEAVQALSQELQAIVGVQIPFLSLPRSVLESLEPSQLGSIVGNVVDASLPVFPELLGQDVGLQKYWDELQEGRREKYPDFVHSSGLRVELKLLFTDNPDLNIQAAREPSARLRIPPEEVAPLLDTLLVVAYQMQPSSTGLYSPTLVDFILLPMVDCIQAREFSLTRRGGKWDNGIPVVPGKDGHFNLDTNFGKLKRIPLQDLQGFLRKHNVSYTSSGSWPAPWKV